MKYLDHRHQLLRTFTGTLYRTNDNQSPLSHGMAQKIAGSGLSYDDLFILYSKFGKTGVIAVLSMEPTASHETKQIHVTKNKNVDNPHMATEVISIQRGSRSSVSNGSNRIKRVDHVDHVDHPTKRI